MLQLRTELRNKVVVKLIRRIKQTNQTIGAQPKSFSSEQFREINLKFTTLRDIARKFIRRKWLNSKSRGFLPFCCGLRPLYYLIYVMEEFTGLMRRSFEQEHSERPRLSRILL